jgi:FKBP-type peptidyl-prolyl cis-trans isomerase SlyD
MQLVYIPDFRKSSFPFVSTSKKEHLMPDKKTTGIQDNHVVTLAYTLIVEEEEMETTRDGKPIQFIQGLGQIIPGLENALYGLEVGEETTVVIPPEEAYGAVDPEAVQKVKKEEFSSEIPLEIGNFLDLRDKDDNVLSAQITGKDEDTVTLDFNHPLAGKELTFEISVVAIRAASQEELDHGHVH